MTCQGFVEIAGTGIRYTLEGRGDRLVVLVHEMGGSLESWDRFVPLIEDRCRILRFDMRGFGLSSKVSGTADLDRMADDLAGLMRSLSIEEPAHLCGMAVGGALIVRFASRYPAVTASLAPMSPALGVATEKREAVRARADRIENEGIPAISTEELAITYPESLRDAVHFPSYRARWLGNDPRSYAATYRMLTALDMAADISAIDKPCLMLAGTLDVLRPPALIEPVARTIAGARFLELKAGHVLAYQAPEDVRDVLVEFWSSIPKHIS